MKAKVKENVQQIIQAIADRNGGRITAEQVVNAARRPDNPLHAHFDWQDDSAAEKYRLMQARALIRQCRVEFRTDHIRVRAVAYVRDPGKDAKEQGYIATTRVKSDEDMSRDVLVDEFRRAEAALKRAHKLASVFDLQSEVAAILREAEIVRLKALDAAPVTLNG